MYRFVYPLLMAIVTISSVVARYAFGYQEAIGLGVLASCFILSIALGAVISRCVEAARLLREQTSVIVGYLRAQGVQVVTSQDPEN